MSCKAGVSRSVAVGESFAAVLCVKATEVPRKGGGEIPGAALNPTLVAPHPGVGAPSPAGFPLGSQLTPCPGETAETIPAQPLEPRACVCDFIAI